jgi:hypothetical protein
MVFESTSATDLVLEVPQDSIGVLDETGEPLIESQRFIDEPLLSAR